MLKFIYDSEAEIPAAYKALFTQQDGKWVLQVEGGVPKAKVDEFRTKNIELQKELDATKERFKDIDPEKWSEYKAAADDLATGKAIKKDGFDKAVEDRVAQMRVDLEKKTNDAVKAREKAENDLLNLRMETTLRDLAIKHGVRKEAMPDVIARGMRSLKLVDGKLIAHDDVGQKRYGKSSDPMGPDEWAEELVGSAPHLFDPNSGGGAAGSGGAKKFAGANPWKKESFNITEQMKVTKSDPDLAKRLKVEAGA